MRLSRLRGLAPVIKRNVALRGANLKASFAMTRVIGDFGDVRVKVLKKEGRDKVVAIGCRYLTTGTTDGFEDKNDDDCCTPRGQRLTTTLTKILSITFQETAVGPPESASKSRKLCRKQQSHSLGSLKSAALKLDLQPLRYHGRPEQKMTDLSPKPIPQCQHRRLRQYVDSS